MNYLLDEKNIDFNIRENENEIQTSLIYYAKRRCNNLSIIQDSVRDVIFSNKNGLNENSYIENMLMDA
jgi:hypothetical protein